MYHLDKNIEHLERIFDQNERKDYLRLDLNIQLKYSNYAVSITGMPVF